MTTYRESFGAHKQEGVTYVYVAGPMRGIPSYNFPAFYDAEEALADGSAISGGQPTVVFNPARNDVVTHRLWNMSPGRAGQWLLDNPQEFSLRGALGDDTSWIAHFADVVCLLPGWENSKGARAEVALARALDIEVWEYEPDGTYAPEFRLLPPDKEGPVQDSYPLSDGEVGDKATVEHLLTNPAARARAERAAAEVDEFAPTWLADRIFGTPVAVKDIAAGEEGTVRFEASEPIFKKWIDGATETRTTSSTGGEKGVKLARGSLVPTGPLLHLMEHYGRGAAKYASHQWRQGYEWSKSYDALWRHLLDFWSGRDWDVCPDDRHGCKETDLDGKPFLGETEHGRTCFNHTGSHHLDAVAWHAFCLREMYETHPEHDDRYIPGKG